MVRLRASVQRQGGHPLKIAALENLKISKTRKGIKGQRREGRRGKKRLRFRKWKIGGRLEFGEEEGCRKLKELILIATPTGPHVHSLIGDSLTGDQDTKSENFYKGTIPSFFKISSNSWLPFTRDVRGLL